MQLSRTQCASGAAFFIMLVSFLEKNFVDKNYTSLLRSKKKHFPRGTLGHWVLDFNYSRRSDYPNYGSYSTWHLAARNFTATPGQPFRLAASYRWVDTSSSSSSRFLDEETVPGYGPLREVSLDNFCTACHTLNITRIILLGDSLSNQFRISLNSLLGFPLQAENAHRFNFHLKPQSIRCVDPEPFTIQTLWMRRSSVEEVMSLSAEGRNAIEEEFVAKNPNKTAIVANFGAWMKTFDEFQTAFESFLAWVDSVPFSESSNRIGPIFYRETVPGHYPCTPKGNASDVIKYNWKVPVLDEPYATYDEFLNSSSNYKENPEAYQWDKFESYNEHARKRLGNRSMSKGALPIPWLNIYNSSVLRRDGHIGFHDCLHYYQPGPTDFWAHFFHSFLYELAEVTNK